MGTTISALLLVGDRGFIAHVGDSRDLHAPPGPGHPAHRGPLADQRADPPGQGHQGEPRPLARTAPTRTRSPARSASTRPSRSTPSTSTSCRATSSCSARTACTPTWTTTRSSKLFAPDEITRDPQEADRPGQRTGGQDNITAIVVRIQRAGTEALRQPHRGADPQGRGAEADAAVPAPHLQGDHPRPQPHRGLGLRPGRGHHARGRAGRRALHPAAGPGPAAQGRRLHHPPGAGRPPRRDGAGRPHAPLGQRDRRGALARCSSCDARSSTRSSARIRRCR